MRQNLERGANGNFGGHAALLEMLEIYDPFRPGRYVNGNHAGHIGLLKLERLDTCRPGGEVLTVILERTLAY